MATLSEHSEILPADRSKRPFAPVIGVAVVVLALLIIAVALFLPVELKRAIGLAAPAAPAATAAPAPKVAPESAANVGTALAPNSAVASPMGAAAPRAPAPVAPAPAQAPSLRPPQSLEGKRARDQVILTALRQFEREAMPVLDSCFGASPGQRKPQALTVTFQHDTGSDRFVVSEVAPTPQRGVAVATDGALQRCSAKLKGMPLGLSAAEAPNAETFSELVTFFLPVPAAP